MAVWVLSNRRWKWLMQLLVAINEHQRKKTKHEDAQDRRLAEIERRLTELEAKK